MTGIELAASTYTTSTLIQFSSIIDCIELSTTTKEEISLETTGAETPPPPI